MINNNIIIMKIIMKILMCNNENMKIIIIILIILMCNINVMCNESNDINEMKY